MISYYVNPMKTKGFRVPTDTLALVKFQFWKLLLFQKMPVCRNNQNSPKFDQLSKALLQGGKQAAPSFPPVFKGEDLKHIWKSTISSTLQHPGLKKHLLNSWVFWSLRFVWTGCLRNAQCMALLVVQGSTGLLRNPEFSRTNIGSKKTHQTTKLTIECNGWRKNPSTTDIVGTDVYSLRTCCKLPLVPSQRSQSKPTTSSRPS